VIALPLGKLTKPVSTWNPVRCPADRFEYIDLSAVDSDAKRIVAATSVSGNSAPSRARQLVAKGDVLVSTVRPNLNSVAVVPAGLDGATASTGFTVLRPGPQLDGRYLFHWVRSPSFVADMVRKATGASYPAVSDRIVKESVIPAPSMDEQRRIAAILDLADALRAKRRQVLGHLHALTQSLFRETFRPRRDQMVRLDSLVASDDHLNYGVVQPGPHVPNGTPLIRISNLRNGAVNSSDIKLVSRDIDRLHARSRIRGDEILVGCVGSIGQISLVTPELVGYNIARAIARVPIEDPTTRRYVAEYLKTATPQEYFRGETRTVAQPTLNIKQLAATLVPLPPKVVQEEFVHRIDSVTHLQDHARATQTLDYELFAGLQSRAFRGEL